MSDDLGHLKSLMDRATPAPDNRRRAENLKLAQANFAALSNAAPKTAQASGPLTRFARFLASKGGVAASAAVAVCAVLLVIPQGLDQSPPLHHVSDTTGGQPAPPAPEAALSDFAESSTRAITTDDAMEQAPQAGAVPLARSAAQPPDNIVQRLLLQGVLPPPDLVDLADLVQRFAPTASPPEPEVALQPTPWNADTQLVIGMRSRSDATPLVQTATGLVVSELARGNTLGAIAPPSADARFIAALIGFGLLLQNQPLGNWDYDAAIALALSNVGDDPTGARSEAITLMQIARDLSG
ncbi:MAG: YfbK domain-containing protein [Yoonia sp.]|uniref:YfbK domain-containing protein n=1 Tax=Yoonia sp. TaxID=2212373 RepID=UPI003EF669E0